MDFYKFRSPWSPMESKKCSAPSSWHSDILTYSKIYQVPPPLVTSTFHNIFRLISNIFWFSDATSTICDVTPANSETIPRFYNPTVDSDSDLLIFFNIFRHFLTFPTFSDISRHSPTVVKSRKMWGNLIFKTFSYRIFCLFSPCGWLLRGSLTWLRDRR